MWSGVLVLIITLECNWKCCTPNRGECVKLKKPSLNCVGVKRMWLNRRPKIMPFRHVLTCYKIWIYIHKNAIAEWCVIQVINKYTSFLLVAQFRVSMAVYLKYGLIEKLVNICECIVFMLKENICSVSVLYVVRWCFNTMLIKGTSCFQARLSLVHTINHFNILCDYSENQQNFLTKDLVHSLFLKHVNLLLILRFTWNYMKFLVVFLEYWSSFIQLQLEEEVVAIGVVIKKSRRHQTQSL